MTTPLTIQDGGEAFALHLWSKLSERQKTAWMTGIEAYEDGMSFEDAMVLVLTEQGWSAAAARARVAEAVDHPGHWREQLI